MNEPNDNPVDLLPEEETVTEGEEETPEGYEEGEDLGSELERHREEEDIPEKFKGKTAAEIAKSYTELERMTERKAEEMAEKKIQERLRQGETLSPKEKGELKQEIQDEIDKVDFNQMDVKAFAKWMDQRVERKADDIARRRYDEQNKINEAVHKEIDEATKEHPLLKENADYREVALALIESARVRGEVMTLKEACKKADKVFKYTKEKKPRRTTVEKQTAGQPAGVEKTEEEKIKEGMLKASKSTLGGLGI